MHTRRNTYNLCRWK